MRKAVSLFLGLCLVLVSTAAGADEPDLMRFWLPGNDWAFELDLSGLVVNEQEIAPTLTGRSLWASDTDNRMLLSIFLDPALEDFTPAQLRDRSLLVNKQLGMDLKNIDKWKRGDAAGMSYDIVVTRDDEEWRQPNIFAYMIHDATYITVHISCLPKEDGDEELFDRLINSARIIEDYEPTTFDYLIFGSWCYRAEDLQSAIRFYEECLAKEKEAQVLPRTYWLAVVDNLGMSYGISGDRKNARKVFEYGLSVEPEYAMFHYNLACVFAEEQKLDSAIACLSKAYENAESMIPGEEIPDPLKDPSFEKYWEDEKLAEFLSGLEK